MSAYRDSTRPSGVVDFTGVRQPSDRSNAQERCLRGLGLSRNPFPVVPDANNFFVPPRVEILIEEVLHTISARKGFVLICGEVGLGKTTISRRLLSELERLGVQTALVLNTFLQGAELIEQINRDFGVEPHGASLQAQMEALNAFLLEQRGRGGNSVIVIDDAQQLTPEALELLRQVSNLETESDKLVQILLVGQPELEEKLAARELRQLNSRIVLRHRVVPYAQEESRQYVQLRLARAGDEGRIRVSEAAYRLLQSYTGGNPRRINIVMDRCLYALFAANATTIDRKLLAGVIADLDGDSGSAHSGKRSGVWIGAAAAVAVTVAAVAALRPAPLGFDLSDRTARTAAQAGDIAERMGLRGGGPAEIVAAPREADAAASPVQATTAAHEPTVPDVRGPVDGAQTVQEFMAAYGLQEFAERMQRGVRDGALERPADEIFAATGLRMVVLDSPPADLIEGFATLELGAGESKAARIALFWRPEMWSSAHFSYYYRNQEIAALQRPLKALGVYGGRVDGIAGALTTEAVRRFQISAGLPATGLPDAATLFALERRARSATG